MIMQINVDTRIRWRSGILDWVKSEKCERVKWRKDKHQTGINAIIMYKVSDLDILWKKTPQV